jgi:hypothetical protein
MFMSAATSVSRFIKEQSLKNALVMLVIGMSAVSISPSVFAQQQSGQDQSSVIDPPDDLSLRQAKRSRQIGDATSDLLSLQASGAVAGPALPMLGVTTNLSWQRYQDSFKFKIPEFFDKKVNENK